MSEIDRITTLLRRQVAKRTPPKCWRDFVATLPEEDDEGYVETVEFDVIGNQFVIDYVDAHERRSHRRILVEGIGYFAGGLSLVAHCYERDARRNFLAERIISAVNAVTGEVLEAPYAYFAALSAKSPTAEALERSAPGIHILTSLAICDGHFSNDEMQAVLRYIDGYASTPEIDWSIVEAFVTAAWPDLRTFDAAVRRLRFQGYEGMRQILKAAKSVVVADGVLHHEEAELMELLMAEIA